MKTRIVPAPRPAEGMIVVFNASLEMHHWMVSSAVGYFRYSLCLSGDNVAVHRKVFVQTQLVGAMIDNDIPIGCPPRQSSRSNRFVARDGNACNESPHPCVSIRFVRSAMHTPIARRSGPQWSDKAPTRAAGWQDG